MSETNHLVNYQAMIFVIWICDVWILKVSNLRKGEILSAVQKMILLYTEQIHCPSLSYEFSVIKDFLVFKDREHISFQVRVKVCWKVCFYPVVKAT